MTAAFESLSKYPSYRSSGVDWIGEIPDHWEVARFKHRLSLVTEKAGDEDHKVALENIESWTGRYIDTDTTYDGNGTSFRARDILFGKLRPYLAKAFLAGSDGQAVGDFHVLRPASQTDPRYAQYFVLSKEFISIVDGSTYGARMPRASWDFISSLPFPFPPIAEQEAIAAFLDRETAKIDALVEEQRRLIDLLKEKRQAVISHAVTNGLNPDAPTVDTGIEWLGHVPKHWEIVPLMRLTEPGRNIMYGIVLPGPSVEDGVPIVKGGDVRPHRLRLELLNRTTVEIERPFARARLKPNDIVYSIRGTIGDAELVPDELMDANITQDVARVSPRADVHNGWLLWALKSKAVFRQLDRLSAGAAVRGINIFDLKRARIPVPPGEEQEKIAEHLSRVVGTLDALVAEAASSMALLVERRSALISACVTGKVSVLHPIKISRDEVLTVIGLEVVARLAHRPTFGRVKLQKVLYLAEAYAGVDELNGDYRREAAGPLDRKLIADIETLLRRNGEVIIEQPEGRGSAVNYRFVGQRPKDEREDLGRLLGDRRERFEQVLIKVGDLDTKGAEAVATLFAVWNDALLDNKVIADEGIITGFLTEWHPEKRLKFKRDELHTWLGWMRRNGIVPAGEGPRTQRGRLVI
ncbi:restriction endonuclease subunit S [Rhizobium leguminosarum]|uniref:Type I restriction modification DNA specificity domain family protein n=1 Tax=Rhizobium leguminosarum TaxID=384 RepID=A0A2Z4YAW5_RHILE|nr:restriction endonuclease subunit S [Rhizobium leguminosarum]AXA37898.1 Type I restriction modification DNA specificity domain family protein [Rhizobium leguminosarum]